MQKHTMLDFILRLLIGKADMCFVDFAGRYQNYMCNSAALHLVISLHSLVGNESFPRHFLLQDGEQIIYLALSDSLYNIYITVIKAV